MLSTEVRTALKTAGYSAKQVSARQSSRGYSESVSVRIKDMNVPFSAIEEIVKSFRFQRYDEGPSGEPLLGGNCYVRVDFDHDAARSVETELLAKVEKGEAFEYRGVRVEPCSDGGWLVGDRFVPKYHAPWGVIGRVMTSWK